MIVHLKGEQNEEVIKENLRAFKNNPRLGKGKHLLSSTVCVSHTQNGKRYYGVSMSANGKKPVKIIIAASCLSYWDNDVAGAVMTYYPDKTKNKSFDGTITLPPYVSCQAFTISTGDRKDPCKSCKDLFGLSSEENKEWSYGNCAEAESLSNLFKNEPTVKEQLQRKSVRDKDRKNAEESVTVHLLKLLGKPEFYTPPMPVQKKRRSTCNVI
ncbi:hypothetical protein EXN66_Car000848 [Channa argus]|uniref:Uncharacterized protein n=1 Tax=Channa argus TaxID=215402 RepID=A0A6G1QYT2_CHAAH|nr:hypothetical protein EXN66_Car000848 [Channa argus]